MNWLFPVCIIIVLILILNYQSGGVFFSIYNPTLLGPGSQCTQDSECDAGACNNNICASPGDVNTTCPPSNCGSGLTCVIGKCLPPQPSGAKCAVYSDCKIGACNNNLCANPGDYGTSCANAPCNDNLFCIHNICTNNDDGAACNVNNPCPAGYYCNGICSHYKTREDFPCAVSSDCEDGLTCGFVITGDLLGRCSSKLENGASCKSASDCFHGYCTDGVCSGTFKSQPGAKCSNSYTCVTNSCNAGECADYGSGPQAIGQPCDGECVDGAVCQEQTEGTGVTICRTTGLPTSDGTCSDNQIVLNGKCYIPRNNGMYCTDSTQCATGFCNNNVCRPSNVLPDATGVCDPRTGPFCPTGYYCSGTTCAQITSNNTACDLGGSNACPPPAVCNPISLTCYTPNDIFVDSTAGYVYDSTSTMSTSTSAPLEVSAAINASSDAAAITSCMSDLNCVGVVSGGSNRFLLSNKPATFATTGTVYPTLFF